MQLKNLSKINEKNRKKFKKVVDKISLVLYNIFRVKEIMKLNRFKLRGYIESQLVFYIIKEFWKKSLFL